MVSIFFYGHPLFGGNDPNFDYYFSNGWFNHQLEVVSCLWLRCTNVKLRWPQATNNQLMINTLVNLKKNWKDNEAKKTPEKKQTKIIQILPKY